MDTEIVPITDDGWGGEDNSQTRQREMELMEQHATELSELRAQHARDLAAERAWYTKQLQTALNTANEDSDEDITLLRQQLQMAESERDVYRREYERLGAAWQKSAAEASALDTRRREHIAELQREICRLATERNSSDMKLLTRDMEEVRSMLLASQHNNRSLNTQLQQQQQVHVQQHEERNERIQTWTEAATNSIAAAASSSSSVAVTSTATKHALQLATEQASKKRKEREEELEREVEASRKTDAEAKAQEKTRKAEAAAARRAEKQREQEEAAQREAEKAAEQAAEKDAIKADKKKQKQQKKAATTTAASSSTKPMDIDADAHQVFTIGQKWNVKRAAVAAVNKQQQQQQLRTSSSLDRLSLSPIPAAGADPTAITTAPSEGRSLESQLAAAVSDLDAAAAAEASALNESTTSTSSYDSVTGERRRKLFPARRGVANKANKAVWDAQGSPVVIRISSEQHTDIPTAKIQHMPNSRLPLQTLSTNNNTNNNASSVPSTNPLHKPLTATVPRPPLVGLPLSMPNTGNNSSLGSNALAMFKHFLSGNIKVPKLKTNA